MGSSEAPPSRGKPGPKPRFTREQIADTALAVVDRDGFDALSLRAVARELDVTPMALYTYVRSSDDLAAIVIERLIEAKTATLKVPDDWRAALHAYARGLAELVGEHPAMLQAYADGAVNTPSALRAANGILTALTTAGLTPQAAAEAYNALHALVLGHCILQRSASQRRTLDDAAVADLPAVQAAVEHGLHLGNISLDAMVDLLIRNLETQPP